MARKTNFPTKRQTERKHYLNIGFSFTLDIIRLVFGSLVRSLLLMVRFLWIMKIAMRIERKITFVTKWTDENIVLHAQKIFIIFTCSTPSSMTISSASLPKHQGVQYIKFRRFSYFLRKASGRKKENYIKGVIKVSAFVACLRVSLRRKWKIPFE